MPFTHHSSAIPQTSIAVTLSPHTLSAYTHTTQTTVHAAQSQQPLHPHRVPRQLHRETKDKKFQRQQPTSGGTVRSSRPANCCQHIPSNRFLDGFLDPSQFSAAKLTHYSSKPQRPTDSSRSWQRILLSGDVHPNPDPTTKYPCPMCARNVTGCGVSYLCNRCSRWVHS